MGIDAVHTKYSTWDGAEQMRKFADNFTPAGTPMQFEYPFIPGYKKYRGGGTQGVDFDDRIDFARMRNYRLNRVKEQLKAFNVGAILSIQEWNTRYITGTWTPAWTTPSSGLRYCMLPATANHAILYEQGEIGYHTRQMAPWLDKVKVAITGAGWSSIIMGKSAHLAQRDKLVQQIVDDLKAYGVANETVAIDVWDPGLLEGFQSKGIKLIPATEIMLQARKIKNEDEVECLRIASAIGDSMFQTMKDMLKPGVKENQIMGAMHKTAYDLGGEVYSGMLVTSGTFSWPNSRYMTDRIIRPRDIVYADVYNTTYNGYHICYYRTFSVGKPPQQLVDVYSRSLEWLYKAISVIKPGITTREVAEQWPPCEEDWSDILVRYEDQTAGSNWAHGIGLSLYELPLIWRGCSLEHPLVLEKGMTFAIETQHGVPGIGGIRHEEMIHVTDTGVEILSQWPIDEITVVDA
ncbi:MAG: Xaa-Pro peptidase family protein [Syntrophobacteraceae bacterium]